MTDRQTVRTIKAVKAALNTNTRQVQPSHTAFFPLTLMIYWAGRRG